MLVTPDRLYLGSHSNGLIVSCTKKDCVNWTTVSSDPIATVVSMATDGKRIFWTNFGSLHGCAADGSPCSINEELEPAQLGSAKAVSVAYAAGALYIETDAGDILSCDPGACASKVTKVAHETKLDVTWSFFGHTVTADDRAVYWAAIDDAGGTPTYRIMKLAK